MSGRTNPKKVTFVNRRNGMRVTMRADHALTTPADRRVALLFSQVGWEER